MRDVYDAWLDYVHMQDVAVAQAVEPTCTEPGLTAGEYCSVCNLTLTEAVEIPALGHDYSDEWTTDKEATCTEAGSKSHHCSRCDDKADITGIEAHGHNYKSVVTEATCTEDGYTTYTCTICNDTYTDDVVDALGHSYSESITTAATCTSNGVKTFVCEKCGSTYTTSVAKLDHTPVTVNGYAATCTQKGYSGDVVCQVCNSEISRGVELDIVAHTYSSVITPATCVVNGYTTYTCTACSYSYADDETATTEHNYDNGFCVNCGVAKNNSCDHLCHQSGFSGFIWKIVCFFWKLFKMNPFCDCGTAHY